MDKRIVKWDRRFLRLAREVSTWSRDPSTKVGAVIADDNLVVGVGFNGFPKGADDSPELYANRNYKMEHVIHAEENSIRYSNRCVNGCTIYTYPMQPCHICAEFILKSGIKRIVSLESNIGRWAESFQKARDLFEKYGLEFVLYTSEFLETEETI